VKIGTCSGAIQLYLLSGTCKVKSRTSHLESRQESFNLFCDQLLCTHTRGLPFLRKFGSQLADRTLALISHQPTDPPTSPSARRCESGRRKTCKSQSGGVQLEFAREKICDPQGLLFSRSHLHFASKTKSAMRFCHKLCDEMVDPYCGPNADEFYCETKQWQNWRKVNTFQRHIRNESLDQFVIPLLLGVSLNKTRQRKHTLLPIFASCVWHQQSSSNPRFTGWDTNSNNSIQFYILPRFHGESTLI